MGGHFGKPESVDRNPSHWVSASRNPDPPTSPETITSGARARLSVPATVRHPGDAELIFSGHRADGRLLTFMPSEGLDVLPGVSVAQQSAPFGGDRPLISRNARRGVNSGRQPTAGVLLREYTRVSAVARFADAAKSRQWSHRPQRGQKTPPPKGHEEVMAISNTKKIILGLAATAAIAAPIALAGSANAATANDGRHHLRRPRATSRPRSAGTTPRSTRALARSSSPPVPRTSSPTT